MLKMKSEAVNFGDFLKELIGKQIYLNADSRKPHMLEAVKDDYIFLTNTHRDNEPRQAFAIQISSIVSTQEIEGVEGIVIYLVK